MKEIIGSIWDFKHSIIGIPTNGVIRQNGELVMGAGLALDAAKRFPQLPRLLGAHVKANGNIPLYLPEIKIVSIPTKNHWRNSSPLNLVLKNTKRVVQIADEHNLTNIVFPRIGCGLGGLEWSQVKPYLETILDDRFCIVFPEADEWAIQMERMMDLRDSNPFLRKSDG